MPAKSVAQRRAAAIAEHHPEKLYKRNQSLKDMSDEELSEFASTKEKNLPAQAGRPARKRKLRRGEFRKGGYDWRDYE